REDGKTTMYVGTVSEDGSFRIYGTLGVSDSVRSVARDVVRKLHDLGVDKTILLTGDNERAGQSIATQTGIREFRARLLPEDKLQIINELKQEYLTVVMVGDGVNDAPALATADIGVAMGAAGT